MSSSVLSRKHISGVYPERQDSQESLFDKFIHNSARRIKRSFLYREARFAKILSSVEGYSRKFENLSDEQLKDEAALLRRDFQHMESVFPLAPRSFALIREVAGRTVGMRHYNSQLCGGWVMLNGMIAEMDTGEGKTLTATLPAATAALAGIHVHIITVNDYLAARDVAWMKPVYDFLGLTSGVIHQGLDKTTRKSAYSCDITYCTNKEVVFDYLKDYLQVGQKPREIQMRLQRLSGDGGQVKNLCMRGLPFAIIDEADSVLIDEAKTPLIISGEGSASYDEKMYKKIFDFSSKLHKMIDFQIDEAEKKITLTDAGRAQLDHDDVVFLKSAKGNRLEELTKLALTAIHIFQKDKEYLVQDQKVKIVDEYTGRIMADRSWERGLHQFIEVKEGCPLTLAQETLARISYQRFFRRYKYLAGMTGTAKEVRGELLSVYGVQVAKINPNNKIVRQGLPAKFYLTQLEKWQAIIQRIKDVHATGRPILIGTRSVAASEQLSKVLSEFGLPHNTLNARMDSEEASTIANAGQINQITVATNMAGRGTDIKLGDGVKELGGLCVIATERHTARRIDRQLFGRCGRQGDPGSYEIYAALDDEVIASAVSENYRKILKIIISSLSLFDQQIGNIIANYSQRKIEKKYYQMRLDILRNDDSLRNLLAFAGRGE